MSAEVEELPSYCQTMEVTDSSGQKKTLVFPKGLDLDRPKRLRTTFSSEQLEQLENHFNANQYLIGSDRRKLADKLGLSETQVKVWYQNRRTKEKRDKERKRDMEIQEEKSTATRNVLKFLEEANTKVVNSMVTGANEVVVPAEVAAAATKNEVPKEGKGQEGKNKTIVQPWAHYPATYPYNVYPASPACCHLYPMTSLWHQERQLLEHQKVLENISREKSKRQWQDLYLNGAPSTCHLIPF